MAIKTGRQQKRYVLRLKKSLRKGVAKAMGKALGEARKELKATSPVKTGKYRKGIRSPRIRTPPGQVIGAIVFTAPHSGFVHRKGYHEGAGRNPEKRGLSRILLAVPDKIIEHVGAELIKAVSETKA